MKLRITVLGVLLFAGISQAADSLQTISVIVPISKDSAQAGLKIWQEKFHHENVFNSQILSDDGAHGYLLTGRIAHLYTDSRIKIDSLDSTSCRISSTFQTY